MKNVLFALCVLVGGCSDCGDSKPVAPDAQVVVDGGVCAPQVTPVPVVAPDAACSNCC